MTNALRPYSAMKDSGVPWLGKVPEHWRVLPNRAVFVEVKERDRPDADMLSVTITMGVTRQRTLLEGISKKDSSNEDKSAYKLVRSGDIVYNKMRAWQGAIGASDYEGIVSPAYVVQRPRDDAISRYLHYLLRTSAFAKEAERWSYGITSDMWSLRPEHFRLIYSCLPPVPEQVAIVRFLDYMDRRIRRYIRAKQKLIKLLEEQKQAIIHRAVTRGLHPDVRLKSSGLEWLGDVPEHWNVRTLGQIAYSFRTGPFGSVLHQADYIEGGTPVINPIHLVDGRIIEDVRCSVAPPVANRLSLYALAEHDLIFSRRGELGRCALVRTREAGWLCGTGCIRVSVNYDGIVPEYLSHALQAPWVSEYLSRHSVGATIQNLNTGILKSIPILLPPVTEQHEILRTVVRTAKAISEAIQTVHKGITRILEYRVRLTADVVTGKFDLREVSQCLPNESDEPEVLTGPDSLLKPHEVMTDELVEHLEEIDV